MHEEPRNTIQIWRSPLKDGEVPYYMYHVHIGIDDVAGKIMRPGNVFPKTDADGWMCWEIPDNVQNRRLVRDSWSDPTFYTIIYVDATIGVDKVLAGIKEKFNAKQAKVMDTPIKKMKREKTDLPIPVLEQEIVSVPEDEVSAPSIAGAGPARAMTMAVRK